VNLPALRAALRSTFDEVTVVAYVRRPSDWYLSRLGQGLRKHSKVRPPSEQAGLCEDVLSEYERVFGEGQVVVRNYNAVTERGPTGLVRDLLEVAELDLQDESMTLDGTDAKNSSISAESLSLMNAYLRSFGASGEAGKYNNWKMTKDLRLSLNRIDRQLGTRKARLIELVAQDVDDRMPDAYYLWSRFGITFDGIDYSQSKEAYRKGKESHKGSVDGLPVPRRVEDLLQVDLDMKQRILEELKKSDWGMADTRNQWVTQQLKDISD
jgi:hypothetical protein